MARLVVALIALAVMSAGSMYWAAAQQEDSSSSSVPSCPVSGLSASIATPLTSTDDTKKPAQCPMMQAKHDKPASGDENKDKSGSAEGCPGCGGCGSPDGACPK